jgi:inosine-uridine nucleoside N-ribohydrolase
MRESLMIKILLDTDIGTDVDDAVCLAYLLAQPECDLLGITTVTGQADRRAALASVLCRQAGREVPIFPGAERPMRGAQRQPVAQQAAALPRWPHETRFPQNQAIEFMRRTVRAHPGEVVLLTIGPLTNAGLLFAADPEIPYLLRGLVLMGGIFSRQPFLEPDRLEWNVTSDIHATGIVYRAPVKLHRSVGLDITQQVVMAAEDVRRKFTAPLLQPVLDFAEIWFEEFFPSITFHDPLTAATLFDEQICSFQPGRVTVDTTATPGLVSWQPGGPGSPHAVAVSVDPERYFAHFFSVFKPTAVEMDRRETAR